MLRLFPLNLVIYPDEKLNLHIFEPRYRQLINECLEHNTTFGVPVFINGQLEKCGTEVKIVALDKKYEDGRMDIKTEGIRVFNLLSFDNPTTGKLYAAGEVEFIQMEDKLVPEELTSNIIRKLNRLYTLLQLEMDITFAGIRYLSYEVGHKIGLSIEQELALLTIPSELERQQYLLLHLDRVIPIVADMEKTKERIRLNGYFKSFDPLNF